MAALPLRPRHMGLFLASAIGVAGCAEEPTASASTPTPELVKPAASLTTPPKARLEALSGEVQVKRAAEDDWATGAEAMDLFENDKVRTVSGASVKIVFLNGSHVKVGENALVSIAETQTRPGEDRSDLTVIEGRIDAELPNADKQSLTVTTPAATVRAGREIVFQ